MTDKKQSCPLTIFFEKHSDSITTNTLGNVLKHLHTKGYKTYCTEDSGPITVDEAIGIFQRSLNYLNQGNSHPQLNKKHLQDNLAFFLKVKDIGFNFIAIDTPKEKVESDIKKHGAKWNLLWQQGAFNAIRNEEMATHIDKACKKYEAGEIIVVGLNHFGILKLLKDKGYTEVKSFYIANGPVSTNKNEALIRKDSPEGRKFIEENFESGIKVIDLYKNPALNATAEVLKEFQGDELSGEIASNTDL